MKQFSIAIAVAISFCIGLGVARPHLETFAAAPASVTSTSVTKIDFDGLRTALGDDQSVMATFLGRLPTPDEQRSAAGTRFQP